MNKKQDRYRPVQDCCKTGYYGYYCYCSYGYCGYFGYFNKIYEINERINIKYKPKKMKGLMFKNMLKL